MDRQRLFEHIDRTGSFSGAMRKNLVEMLDGVGLNIELGIGSCHNLFDAPNHLVHFTSAVGAPIFRNGDNYTGHGPAMLRLSMLGFRLGNPFSLAFQHHLAFEGTYRPDDRKDQLPPCSAHVDAETKDLKIGRLAF
jgi:hypothetical protein